MKTTITAVQLEVLRAAVRVEVSKTQVAGRDFGTWRIGGRRGRAVTIPAKALMRKKLVKLADKAADDGRLYAVVTAAGYETLSEVAHRG